jgi:hypothetical protein
MSISNYGELKTAVANYLNRGDLTSYIPDFIRLAERRISYGSDVPYSSEPLRVAAMQQRATGTIASSAISYPSGFLEVIRLKVSDGTNGWTLDPVSPGVFTVYENREEQPTVYALLNNTIVTAGTTSIAYTLDYWGALTALSGDSDTNWVLTNAPDVYLFASLLESAPFIADLQMIQGWYGMYKSIVSSLNRTTKRAGGGALAVTAR